MECIHTPGGLSTILQSNLCFIQLPLWCWGANGIKPLCGRVSFLAGPHLLIINLWTSEGKDFDPFTSAVQRQHPVMYLDSWVLSNKEQNWLKWLRCYYYVMSSTCVLAQYPNMPWHILIMSRCILFVCTEFRGYIGNRCNEWQTI